MAPRPVELSNRVDINRQMEKGTSQSIFAPVTRVLWDCPLCTFSPWRKACLASLKACLLFSSITSHYAAVLLSPYTTVHPLQGRRHSCSLSRLPLTPQPTSNHRRCQANMILSPELVSAKSHPPITPFCTTLIWAATGIQLFPLSRPGEKLLSQVPAPGIARSTTTQSQS